MNSFPKKRYMDDYKIQSRKFSWSEQEYSV